ncbi:MAG: alpha/beta fold hydrolase [Deltaproteobacteria bacterium]|nr:alpha/beta fold hydrolase [Deltaproteobacteria bacterium]
MKSPRIELSSNRIVIDQETEIRLSGFRPYSQVTITATLSDDTNTEWCSEAAFNTDGTGSVDLSRTAPVSGTYAGTDCDGLFWSMAPVAPEKYDEFKLNGAKEEAARTPSIFAHASGLPYYESDRPDVIRLEACVDGKTVASAELMRDRFPTNVIETEVADGSLRGLLFEPKGKPSLPGIIRISGSGGGVSRQESSILASHGFSVLNLAYFNYRDLPAFQYEISLEYFREGIEWLQKHIGHDRIALVGPSRGGEGVLAIASAFPEKVAAVVANVPGDVYGSGADDKGNTSSAWSLGGQPLPYAGTPEDYALVAPELLDVMKAPEGRIFESARAMAFMLDPAVYERTAIPIERIQCPILFISGRDDQCWSSYEMSLRAVKRLKEKGFEYPVKHLGFEDAGHMLSFPGLPTTMGACVFHPHLKIYFTMGGRPAATARAQRQSWQETIRFLKDVLA